KVEPTGDPNNDPLVDIFSRINDNLRGYTGHEPVSLGGDKRIIHMNGRVYDAETGRFMQADPFVQAPSNLQNYNAYSYVLNNPLSYTDPSGYIFKKLHNLTKKVNRQIIRGVVKVFGAEVTNIVGNMLTAFCGPAQAACAAAWNYEFTRAMGGSSSQAFKAGLTSAATSQLGGGGGFENAFARFMFDGIVGGIMSDINGGNFGHGFWAAGLNSAVGGGNYVSNQIGNVIVSAVVGGTISKITGGKFKNGAYSAAFVTAVRTDWGGTRGQFNNNADVEEGYQSSVDTHGSQEASFKLSDDLSLDYTVSGSEGFAGDVASHLGELNKTATGHEMLVGLAESGTGLAIFENFGQSAATGRGFWDFSWDRTIIALDPRAVRAPVGLFQTVSGRAARPYVSAQHTLAHELVHAWQNTAWSNGAPKIPHNITGSSPWETQAAAYTNLIRQQQGHRYRRIRYN
ncbi:RHS repeat-associated core domain-containing protein, partial [Pseudoalteromonas sp. OOF1S-7]|uniref:RHS repeat-associated core domain-containing protein n=1 Tax=Pseudoalteromonas sp. OOF1S-7 TaxID=2917757 RepID=UPI001EF51855